MNIGEANDVVTVLRELRRAWLTLADALGWQQFDHPDLAEEITRLSTRAAATLNVSPESIWPRVRNSACMGSVLIAPTDGRVLVARRILCELTAGHADSNPASDHAATLYTQVYDNDLSPLGAPVHITWPAR